MATKIDSHHHFWKYTPAEYGWIGDDMKAIRRDFLPADLEPTIRAAGIDGVVSVQARQTIEETAFLLDHANRHSFIRGVVGWAPLADPKVGGLLENLRGQKKLKGMRHVVQGEPDDNFILGKEFNRGVSELKKFGLVYDILIFERHLAPSVKFVDQHPDQVFVIDHVAKPRIKDRVVSPWREQMKEIARRPNVYCKVSGMATEANWKSWTEADLKPYLDTVIEAFGPRRLMFGSDWPVMLVACPYQKWVDAVSRATAAWSAPEKERFWGGTAVEAYKL
jgi:L-fuconolactonase